MKPIAPALFLLCCCRALPQIHWQHEVLFNDVTNLATGTHSASISDDGVPIYMASRMASPIQHTYLYRTDLNALYFSVPSVGGRGVIGRSGKVAFAARTGTTYHVIGDGRDYFAEVEAPSLDGDVYVSDVDVEGRPVWSRTFTQWQDRFYYGTTRIGQGLPLDNYGGRISPNGNLIWGGTLLVRLGLLRVASTSTTRPSPSRSSGRTTTRTLPSSTTTGWLLGAAAVTTSEAWRATTGSSSSMTGTSLLRAFSLIAGSAC
ncbi:MAG: hypothetical protein HRF45_12315 [Fimbriimonadia bacterium]|jgi:hypothetical protein